MAQPTSSTRASITPYLLYLVLITTLGPLQFGYHLGELNAPERVIRCPRSNSSAESASRTSTLSSCIPMTEVQFGLVSSIYTLGGLIGALLAGPFSTRAGRLLPIRITTLLHALGPLLSTLAPSMALLAAGRFVSGLGSGAAIVVVPVYVAEIAPATLKGLLGASTQVMINVGIVIAQLLGYFLSYGSVWRAVLGVAGMIAVIQAVGLSLAVESPEWLASKGHVQLARTILERIRGTADVQEEAQKWESGGDAQESESLLPSQPSSPSILHPSAPHRVGIISVLAHPNHRRAVVAVVGVMLAQQFCGINSVIMYSVSFLSALLPSAAGLITLLVGVVNLVVTILCAPLPDRLGRRLCLILSMIGMGISATLLGVAITVHLAPLSAIATLLFVASFALGLGPVPFMLASELVDAEAVGSTQSWALAANWAATFVVALLFPVLWTALGGRVFFGFAVMAAGFAAFVTWYVPESRGKQNADEVWGRVRRED